MVARLPVDAHALLANLELAARLEAEAEAGAKDVWELRRALAEARRLRRLDGELARRVVHQRLAVGWVERPIHDRAARILERRQVGRVAKRGDDEVGALERVIELGLRRGLADAALDKAQAALRAREHVLVELAHRRRMRRPVDLAGDGAPGRVHLVAGGLCVHHRS